MSKVTRISIPEHLNYLTNSEVKDILNPDSLKKISKLEANTAYGRGPQYKATLNAMYGKRVPRSIRLDCTTVEMLQYLSDFTGEPQTVVTAFLILEHCEKYGVPHIEAESLVSRLERLGYKVTIEKVDSNG